MTAIHSQPMLEQVLSRIAPVWPLKNFVAVNPYSGFTDTPFSEAAEILHSRGDVRLTKPLAFYLDLYTKGKILPQDVKQALDQSSVFSPSLVAFLTEANELAESKSNPSSSYNLIDIASHIDQKNWTELMTDRISFWASAYFDEHIATWQSSSHRENLFIHWKKEASVDRTTEIMGLQGFRKSAQNLPDDPDLFIESYLSSLKLSEEQLEAYLHALLLKVYGWSSYISGLDFQTKVYGTKEGKLRELLAILLAWENYFFEEYKHKTEVRAEWYTTWHEGEPRITSRALHASMIFQSALDISQQRELCELFETTPKNEGNKNAKAQMVFCIDVRSEVYRRNLEQVDPEIETLGFAGFFGLPLNYIPLGHNKGKNQCPALLPSQHVVREEASSRHGRKEQIISDQQISQIWKKFKSGAVSSFGFVSPLGLSFLPKILKDSFRLTPFKKKAEKRNLDLSEISLEAKVNMAANALTGMGIINRFAPLVILTGHGSNSTNNPHAAGLECGACGGHSGEINALAAQIIFNDSEVRNELAKRNILIPKDTLFVACLHDTTSDEIRFINKDIFSPEQKSRIESIKETLLQASNRTRTERMLRLTAEIGTQSNSIKHLQKRGLDWSQIRPEWGLAGCHSFIVAPRQKTKDKNLGGKSFLHNYDHHQDPDYKILESILTAPMVVTSWINLQYYASTTDNLHLGAGNKTLHNIVSGVGVLEGSGGDLRIGLPLQSIRNGEKLEHLPLRLNVVIDAPIEAINQILGKHPTIQQLFDNQWIYLHRMDEAGRISHTYTFPMKWSNRQNNTSQQTEELLTLKMN